MDLKGKVLGNRYEIIEKIGSGGMATVYKAKCRVLNRYVAIKILRDEFTTDDEFIKRFQVEAQSAASITHPNIVSIYDVAKIMNINYRLVYKKASSMGINIIKHKRYWTDEDINYLRTNFGLIPIEVIARNLNRSVNATIHMVKDLKLGTWRYLKDFEVSKII